jgi:uncharacterized FlgJ-related protein
MKEEEISEETLKIPHDMSIDIFAIIVKEGLKHEILEVIENRSLIIMAVQYNKNQPRHQNVRQNIQDLLKEYHEYRWEENEELNWKEDENGKTM